MDEDIQVTARHVDVSDRVRQYAIDRTQKLERYYDGIDVYQKRLSATDKGETYDKAINQCVDALRRQLEKYKSQLRSTDKDAH
jgi:putative sigma-54 modulation protein